jgi:hypothetical protein
MIDTTHGMPEPRVAVAGDRDLHSDTPAMPTAVRRTPSNDDVRDEASAWVSTFDDNSDAIANPTSPGDANEPAAAPRHPAAVPPHPAGRDRAALLIAVIIAGAVTVALIAVVAAPRMRPLVSASEPARGQLAVLSDTPARVSIDGTDRGPTPIEVTLDAGPHAVRVSGGVEADSMTVVITAGGREVHHVHAVAPLAPVADTGTLRITTPEAGARIVLDGEFRGLTPMSFAALSPGVHHITVVTRGVSIRRDVTIEPQRTIDLELMPTAAAPTGSGGSGGWLVVSSPFDVEIWENGALIGSSRSARVMLSPGSHSIDVVSQLLGYRDHRTIVVTAGLTTPLRLVAPQGTLSVNATPWADVWVDGTKVGETPIGEIPLTIGSHDVLLRHPELGERHVQSVVRVGEVTRVTQDLRQRGTKP